MYARGAAMLEPTDFVDDNAVILELKTTERLLPVHQAQLLSYLKATGCNLGLLINFHDSLLKNGIKRVIFGPPDTQS